MNKDQMLYPNSNMPSGVSDSKSARKSITSSSSERVTETQPNYVFPSMADTELVEMPLPRGRTGPCGAKTESVQVGHVSNHIVTRVSQAIETWGIYKDAEDAPSVFGHYVGALQGSGMVDKATSRALDKLVADFGKTAKSEQRQFFESDVRPYIKTLKTASR